MMMRLLSFFLLFPLTLYGATVQELLSLHQQGEAALQKKEFSLAASCYKKLLTEMAAPSSPPISWQQYIDTTLRYTDALFALDDLHQAEKILNDLLALHPPEQFHPMIKLAHAKTQRGPHGMMRAYLEMQEIEKVSPSSLWPTEMRLFLTTTEMTLNEYFDGLLQKASRFIQVKEMHQALSCYQEVAEAIEKKIYPRALKETTLQKKIHLAIANIHYELHEYQQTIMVTKNQRILSDSIDSDLLCLAAKAYIKTKEYQAAISLLEQQLGERKATEEYLRTLYELAFVYSKAGNVASAKEKLELILKKSTIASKTSLFAAAALSQLYLNEKNLLAAKKTISLLDSSHDGLLQGKFSSLQGQLKMEEGLYEEAIPFLIQAMPTQRHHVQSLLAYAYLACNCELEEAERLLSLQLKGRDPSQPRLLLAFLYQQKGENEKSIHLIEEHFPSLSVEEQFWADILLARGKTEKNFLHETYLYCHGYPHGWFYSGIEKLEKNEQTQAIECLKMAVAMREEPSPTSLFALLYREDIKKASTLLSKFDRDHENYHTIKILIESYSNAIIRKQQLSEAEAYFAQFPLKAYLEARPDAISHLLPFTKLFPDSTLTIAASYLLGLNANTLEEKKQRFEDALNYYEKLSPNRRPKGAFYFQAKALVELTKISQQEPFVSLKALLHELKDEEKSILFKGKNGLCLLREECRLILAKAYINNKKYYKAQRLLFDIMKAYSACGIGKGYFLALAWQEQAHLAYRQGNMQVALESYDLALESGDGFLSEDEKIAIWLQQSDCRLQLKIKR